jgi:hypothetical protein
MQKKIKTGKYTKMRKRMIAGGVIALGLAIGGVGAAQAASTPGTTHMSSLVNAIATKFNLNAADVQAVIDEQMKTQRVDMEIEHTARLTERLTKAVADGKITQIQADLITAKYAELQAVHETMKTTVEKTTPAERMETMNKEMETLKQWAADNNIPEEFMMFKFGGPGMGSAEMKGGMMMRHEGRFEKN